MKKNNKTWIQQLSESYIRQALNEMAVTPAGMKKQQEIQAASDSKTESSYNRTPDTSRSIQLVADRHREYHELLQTHPTKIFDGTGQHVGNIGYQALPGHEGTEMGGVSAEAVAEHEKQIREVATKLNYRINAHNAEVSSRGDDHLIIPDDHRPHPDHVNDSGSRTSSAYTARDHREVPPSFLGLP